MGNIGCIRELKKRDAVIQDKKNKIERRFFMHNRNKYKLLLIILIGLSCIFSTKCGVAKLRILILYEIVAAQFEVNGEEKVPVYSFDPRKEIQKSLKGAGFKVVLREDQDY
ncbi:MAG TPA: hypothetical protein ENH65_03910, partial [Candidatus Aminicenantes bacterium]|nr:hypothetical protein [Candidatus Aminicenantes bacterium]